jgi:hypothetical protein
MATNALKSAALVAALLTAGYTAPAQAVENYGGWKQYYYKYAYSHVREHGQARRVDRHINGRHGHGGCGYLLDRYHETGRQKWLKRYEDCRGW